jgi:hypothetical protein
MLADVWKVGAIWALSQWVVSSAAADALPLKKSLELGHPARALQIEIVEGDALALRVAGSTLSLPARKVRSADLAAVSVADDAAVAILRVSAENGEWVALLGGRSGKELLAVERSAPWGDPGERRALIVQAEPLQEGGQLQRVSVGMAHEGLGRCGDSALWRTDRRVIDPKTLKLVPAPELARAPAPPLEAQPVAPSAPRLPLLTATSSSQVDALTGGVHVPRELVDGRADSSFRLESGGLALLRWGAPALPMTQLVLLLGSRTGPVSLRLSLERAAFDVSVPKPAGTEDRVVVQLPAETRSSCVSLELAGAGAVALAEVQAFSQVDQPDGLDRLVGDLVQDGEKGALAAELLPQLGEPAARAVTARFVELSVRGRRRALKTLAPYLALPEVQARVVEAARSADPALSQAAFEVLYRGKEPGRAALRQLALSADGAGDRAAQLLAQRGASDAAGLLAALGAAGGAERAVLRRALIAVAKHDPEPFRAASEAFLGAGPNLSARIALALVAASAELDELAGTTLEGALAAERFEDRFRLCLAAAELPASPAVDAWLARQAAEASEWMQRRAAWEALLARGSEQVPTLVARVAKDPYPRVRAAAAPALVRSSQPAPLAELAQKDPWPLVRAAATTGLGELPRTRAVLEGQLTDSSRYVRAASIEGLLKQREAGAWPLVAQRLSAQNEWPLVQSAAVRFAAGLCVQAAHPALTETARRALRPDASDEDRQLGVEAIHALHDLGGQAEEDARLLATREAASPALQRTYGTWGPSRCTASAARTAP